MFWSRKLDSLERTLSESSPLKRHPVRGRRQSPCRTTTLAGHPTVLGVLIVKLKSPRTSSILWKGRGRKCSSDRDRTQPGPKTDPGLQDWFPDRDGRRFLLMRVDAVCRAGYETSGTENRTSSIMEVCTPTLNNRNIQLKSPTR